ncbi:DUF3102 domain-containing protein [Geobacillus vulcani]|uniref:DUF3102 domain-containing protein n=1 Tax=Geobacillus vulcani TaxID=135517 RepID=UPI0009007002|nr:DUF3102 domain-containing protein [Geobacillus vulcani]
MKNEVAELSNDLNVITAEINSYKQIAGQAIFEIGRRLKHVKEKKLAEKRGGWTAWLREIQMSTSQADRFIKVAKEFDEGKLPHVGNIRFRALYEIATMPETERFKPHTILSTGETKTVDEMTVRELREVKKALKEERERRERAEREAEELSNQPPKIKTARSSLAFFFVVVVAIDYFQ